MTDDPLKILDAAVATAAARGHAAVGWMLVRSQAGYVAWVYTEDDEGSWSLFDAVDEKDTPLLCARWCLAAAEALPDISAG